MTKWENRIRNISANEGALDGDVELRLRDEEWIAFEWAYDRYTNSARLTTLSRNHLYELNDEDDTEEFVGDVETAIEKYLIDNDLWIEAEDGENVVESVALMGIGRFTDDN